MKLGFSFLIVRLVDGFCLQILLPELMVVHDGQQFREILGTISLKVFEAIPALLQQQYLHKFGSILNKSF